MRVNAKTIYCGFKREKFGDVREVCVVSNGFAFFSKNEAAYIGIVSLYHSDAITINMQKTLFFSYKNRVKFTRVLFFINMFYFY